VAAYLLSKGADANRRCLKGNTPLHAAFERDAMEVIMLLMMNGGDIAIMN
jgi:ankyrin repeat protein